MPYGKMLLALFTPLMSYLIFDLPLNYGWVHLVSNIGALPSFTLILILHHLPWGALFVACGAFSRYLVPNRAIYIIALSSGLMVAGYKAIMIRSYSESIGWEWILFQFALPPICVILGAFISAKLLRRPSEANNPNQ